MKKQLITCIIVSITIVTIIVFVYHNQNQTLKNELDRYKEIAYEQASELIDQDRKISNLENKIETLEAELQEQTPTTYQRSTVSSDFEMDVEWNSAERTADIYITPNQNIESLVLEFYFYNENGELLFTVKKAAGNLTKGHQIVKKIALYNYVEKLSVIRKTEVKIISGTTTILD